MIWSVRKPPSCWLEPVQNTNRQISLNSGQLLPSLRRISGHYSNDGAHNGKTHQLQDTDDLSHVEYSCSTTCSSDRLCLPPQSLPLLFSSLPVERDLLLLFQTLDTCAHQRQQRRKLAILQQINPSIGEQRIHLTLITKISRSCQNFEMQ